MIETTSTVANTKPDEEIWSVVVLYEDKPTRDCAMAMCDRLVKNFWLEVEFDFRWWRTDFLRDPRMAQAAVVDAAGADIFIFSSGVETGLSPVFLKWFESWSDRREAREGMFLDLTGATAQGNVMVQKKQARLREIAAKAKLDYFNRIPPPLGEQVLDSWQSMEARTNQVTKILDDILHRLPPPSHFGLNE